MLAWWTSGEHTVNMALVESCMTFFLYTAPECFELCWLSYSCDVKEKKQYVKLYCTGLKIQTCPSKLISLLSLSCINVLCKSSWIHKLKLSWLWTAKYSSMTLFMFSMTNHPEHIQLTSWHVMTCSLLLLHRCASDKMTKWGVGLNVTALQPVHYCTLMTQNDT